MTHTCHARGCPAEVPPRMLMCRYHWSHVPKKDQIIVYRLYRPGQELDKRPSASYLRETNRIIAELAIREQTIGLGLRGDVDSYEPERGTLRSYFRRDGV